MKTSIFVIALFLVVTLIQAAEYDRILQDMNTIVNTDGTYAQLMDIGKNDQGNTIYGLRLENVNYLADGEKINHLIVGVHHGNERTTADVSVLFAKKIIAIFKNNSAAEYNALSRCVFYVIPVLNIPGFNSNSRYERGASGSYDPNRDYEDPCASNKYFQLSSTKNLAYFIERQNIVGAVTSHGYVGTFTFPWGIDTSNTHTADHAFYTNIATQSAKANGYRVGTHTDLIYAATGAFEDWAYYKFGIWTMLLEQKNSPNQNNDANCLVTYFTLVPAQRSTQHSHDPNNCRSSRATADEPGRP